MAKIPLIIPVFNQVTYLKNLVIWWRWYHPDSENYPIYIVDNGSTSEELFRNYEHKIFEFIGGAEVIRCAENSFVPNLRKFIDEQIIPKYEYYVISDPDIFPHPATPTNFLEIWKKWIDEKGYQRAGFNLLLDKLPPDLNRRANIIYDETQLLHTSVGEEFGFTAFRAPIDTTFCMYKTANGGWHSPMSGNDWGNCIRLFEAFHLPWYITSENVNQEMEYYFKSCKTHVIGTPSAGNNNNMPLRIQNERGI